MYDALFSIARALNIQRPLVFFDSETTGVNVDEDRIVEISFAKVMRAEREAPGISVGGFLAQTGGRLINPMRPIPQGASDVHGITDEAVSHAPTFGQAARELAVVFTGADLAAYNGRRFDVKLLAKEFERAGEMLAAKWVTEARILDPFVIFTRRESRDLTAALKFYTNRELGADAHGAEADTHAAIEVLAAQLVRDGQPCINFGKYAGVSLPALVARDVGFIQWVLSKDFPEDTKQILRDALRRTFPTPPAGKVA